MTGLFPNMAGRDTRARFNALIDAQRKEIRRAFMQSVGDVQAASEAKLQAIIGHLEAGNIPSAVAAAMIDDAFYAPLDRAITAAFVSGALYQQGALPARPFGPGGGRLVVRFDGRNPRAENWLRTNSSRLISQIQEGQREAVRTTLEAGMASGRNPRSVALDIVGRVERGRGGRRRGGIIGLHDQFASYVSSARAELADPDAMANYLTRTRRDKRFDAVVRRALRSGKPVPQRDIDRMAGRYADRLLALRGEMVARSEAIEALNAGRAEGMAQVIEDPSNEVQASDLTRTWDATSDSRTRPAHSDMEGQQRPEGVPFDAPDGSRLMYPGDTSLGASGEMTIGCRCYMKQDIDFLAIARRRRGAA